MKVRTRIALYSHDTVGLGHIRRNLLIARALASSPLEPAILLIAGNYHANAFGTPPGVDSITLPALQKDSEGRYASGALPVPLQRLVTLRARTIRAALQAFDPDLLIVDKVPSGALGELMPTLAALKARGRARCVLGLRDILDEPDAVRREWRAADNDRVIRDHYAGIWVYGDANVYNLAEEYGFCEDVRERMTYTGYLDQTVRLDMPPICLSMDSVEWAPPSGRHILCTVGGGQDGSGIARAFAAARLPDGARGVVLTGPFMPQRSREQLKRAARASDHLFVVEFVSEATRLLQRAQHVVTMGGYNTVSEVLAFGKPALVIPRVAPRREQLIRAEQLHRLGLVDVLHPRRLTPKAISEWLAREHRVCAARSKIDLDGLLRMPILAQELLVSTPVGAAS